MYRISCICKCDHSITETLFTALPITHNIYKNVIRYGGKRCHKNCTSLSELSKMYVSNLHCMIWSFGVRSSHFYFAPSHFEFFMYANLSIRSDPMNVRQSFALILFLNNNLYQVKILQSPILYQTRVLFWQHLLFRAKQAAVTRSTRCWLQQHMTLRLFFLRVSLPPAAHLGNFRRENKMAVDF